MKIRQSPGALLILLGLAAAPGTPRMEAQAVGAVCPADSTGGRVHDGNGVYRSGTSARRYVTSFLSGDPAATGRTSTGTSVVDTTMIRQLREPDDAIACRRLNAIMNNGESETKTSSPWVYFRAGSFYLVARWTPAQSRSDYTLRHEAVVVFDAKFNFLGAWTA